jgi:hypothetical protein
MEQFILIKNKKAQIWGLDLIIASIIFLTGIIILFYYAINILPQSKNQLDEFFYEGNLASDLILSEDQYGILSESKVNQTKLESFNSWPNSTKKNLLGVTNNFYFTMEGMNVSNNYYIGMINTSDTDTLVKVTRITIYNDRPTKFELYVWR